MLTINMDNLKIIPLDFWAFYNDASKYIGRFKFSKNQCISEEVFEILCQELEETPVGCIVAIDMSNISSYPMHLFSKFNDNVRDIFFFNVTEDNIRIRMDEDLSGRLFWPEKTIASFTNDNFAVINKLVYEQCSEYRKLKHVEILKSKMLTQKEAPYHLESSGLYSNCYLSVKKIFREVEDFYYIIYSLAQRISELKHFDAFVTSSKNGAIIATVLGDILNIKEVHLIGIGPKYSMELDNSVDSIKAGKRYVYIFDFMCTGTELKIVSALINAKKGVIKGAVGISRYKEDICFSLDGGINILAEGKDLGVNYIISGDIGDIEKLEGGCNNG